MLLEIVVKYIRQDSLICRSNMFSIWIKDIDGGYSLSINNEPNLFFQNKEEMWVYIYSIVKDVDFSKTKVSLTDIEVSDILVLYFTYKYII